MRSSTHIHTRVGNWTSSKVLVVTGLLVGFGLITCIPSTADAGHKKFYVTLGGFHGNQALTACDRGFHMASLWEIFDPSNLEYDTKRGYPGFTDNDLGSGPPVRRFGWIRTGEDHGEISGTGIANCQTWTSNSGSDNGTEAALDNYWLGPTTQISPWTADEHSCDQLSAVWCVQN